MERYDPKTAKWSFQDGEGWHFPWLAIGTTLLFVFFVGGLLIAFLSLF